VRTVAEGLVRGISASAEADGRTSRQAEFLTLGIEYFEIAFNLDRTVVVDYDFRSCHYNQSTLLLRLRLGLLLFVLHLVAECDVDVALELLVVLILHGHADALGA
jgi:hypothetical protein